MSSNTLQNKTLDINHPYSDDDIATLSKALKQRDNISFYQCPNFSEDPTGSEREQITTGIFSHNNQTFIELPAISDPALSPIGDRLREQLEFLTYLSSPAVENPITVKYPIRILAPYKLEYSWHWNILQITIDEQEKVSCKSFNTDGKSYPVGPQVFADIADFFGNFTAPDDTSYQPNPTNQIGVKIEYDNHIQAGVNCGLGSSIILHDLITGEKPGNNYDTLSQKSDIELRQIAFDIVEEYNCESLTNFGKEDLAPRIDNAEEQSRPPKKSKKPKAAMEDCDPGYEKSDDTKGDFQDNAEQNHTEQDEKNEQKEEAKTKQTKPPEPLTNSELRVLEYQNQSDKFLARTLNQDNHHKPRSYSGIGTKCNASYNKSKNQFELTIAQIIPGSVADKIGLKAGDVIACNSQTDSQQALQEVITAVRNMITSNGATSGLEQEVKLLSGNPQRSQNLYTKISSQAKNSSAKIFIHKGEAKSKHELLTDLKLAKEVTEKPIPKTTISGQVATKEQKELERKKEVMTK